LRHETAEKLLNAASPAMAKNSMTKIENGGDPYGTFATGKSLDIVVLAFDVSSLALSTLLALTRT